jgi:hypothetical protein
MIIAEETAPTVVVEPTVVAPPSAKVPKPIKATEIKAYLHSWCTQQGVKPTYTYQSEGKPPKVGNYMI